MLKFEENVFGVTERDMYPSIYQTKDWQKLNRLAC